MVLSRNSLSIVQSNDEKTKPVGMIRDRFAVQRDRLAGLDGDTAQPGGGASLDRDDAHGGQVEAQILAWAWSS